MNGFRFRFWIESVSCAATASLALVTLISPDWIELTTGLDPDRHSGSVEWLAVAVLMIASVTLGLLARGERRHRLVSTL
jgi:hypothetical protein